MAQTGNSGHGLPEVSASETFNDEHVCVSFVSYEQELIPHLQFPAEFYIRFLFGEVDYLPTQVTSGTTTPESAGQTPQYDECLHPSLATSLSLPSELASGLSTPIGEGWTWMDSGRVDGGLTLPSMSLEVDHHPSPATTLSLPSELASGLLIPSGEGNAWMDGTLLVSYHHMACLIDF